jgi:hypothetical protein
MLLSRSALAAQCLTGPAVLPFLGGPPTWFNPNAASPLWRAELQDPRWAGAPIYTLCDNPVLTSCAPGAANAQFRVLIDGTTLYLAIHNLADDGADGNDAVFVGVAQSKPLLGARAASIVLGGTPVIVPAGIRRDTIAPAPVPPHLVVSYSATTATNPGSWARDVRPANTMPDWIAKIGTTNSVAVWTDSPGVTWAVTLAIDLTKLGYAAPIDDPVNDVVRLFVGSRHVPNVCPTPGTCSQVPLPNVTTNVVDAPETIVPSNPGTWTEFNPAPGCTGIEINPSSIGVANDPDPLSTKIKACPPSGPPWPAGCPEATNTFRVIPHNVPAPFRTTAHSIRAKLRLANWGSTIDSLQHAPWQDMPDMGTPFETPNAIDLAPGWSWSDDAAGSPTIQFACPISGHTYCPFIGNAGTGAGQSTHQCMLAELRAQPGVNTPFASSAAYRNMIFENLSSVSTDATLTIKGLQALTGKVTPRDLYLYVQTRNMPAHSDTPMELRPELMTALLRYAENPPPRPSARRPTDDGPIGLASNLRVEKFDPISLADIASGKVTDLVQLPPANNPLLVPTLTDDQALGLAWPSYRVYVYYDTGERQVVGGAQRITLAPMVPFGYYLKHAGTFFGFEHALAGSGVQLDVLGNDWYRVRVENEGSVIVKTSVSAEEKPPCTDCQPPGKVPPKPICFCSAPGLSTPGASSWLPLALLTLLVAARTTRKARVLTNVGRRRTTRLSR